MLHSPKNNVPQPQQAAQLPGVIPPSEAEVSSMQHALAQAKIAAAEGEVPVGAVVLDANGAVIASGRNSRISGVDPFAHAEVNALRQAAALRGERMLDDCTLVVTLEPCVMCAGAILAARIGRVIFAAWDEKAGAAGSVYDLLRDGRLPHQVPEVVAGVCERESVALLQQFFQSKR